MTLSAIQNCSNKCISQPCFSPKVMNIVWLTASVAAMGFLSLTMYFSQAYMWPAIQIKATVMLTLSSMLIAHTALLISACRRDALKKAE